MRPGADKTIPDTVRSRGSRTRRWMEGSRNPERAPREWRARTGHSRGDAVKRAGRDASQCILATDGRASGFAAPSLSVLISRIPINTREGATVPRRRPDRSPGRRAQARGGGSPERFTGGGATGPQRSEDRRPAAAGRGGAASPHQGRGAAAAALPAVRQACAVLREPGRPPARPKAQPCSSLNPAQPPPSKSGSKIHGRRCAACWQEPEPRACGPRSNGGCAPGAAGRRPSGLRPPTQNDRGEGEIRPEPAGFGR